MQLCLAHAPFARDRSNIPLWSDVKAWQGDPTQTHAVGLGK